MKSVHFLLGAIAVAGFAGVTAPSHGDPARVTEEPQPIPASAVESLGDPHAGMDMDPESDEMAGEDDLPAGEMPDDDIHRGMR